MEGMIVNRRQPYAHWISWIPAKLGQNVMMHELKIPTTQFKEYSPTAPRDGRRRARG